MAGPRDYTRATLMALAHHSGGICYYPGCLEPVLQEVEGKLHFVVQIAHICGAEPGGPRYDSAMTDDERRDFPNLMLFCTPHHGTVDDRSRVKVFTAEVLLRWKAQHEADSAAALKRLRDVTPAALQKALEKHDGQMLAAITRLEAHDREAATLLRGLVDELAEAYSKLRQTLTADMVEEFSAATHRLDSINALEMSELLDIATSRLERLHPMDVAEHLDEAATRLASMQRVLNNFTNAAMEIG
jgi:hypothetical protein